MDRRYFLISGGAATAAAASSSLMRLASDAQSATAPSATAKAALPAAPALSAIQASRAVDSEFQLAFVPHEYSRASMLRQRYDAPLRLVFYGFGYRSKASTLDSLIVDAGHTGLDMSAHRHMLWAYSKRATGNPVRLTVSRSNFAGFLAQTARSDAKTDAKRGAKAGGVELYVPGGDVPWDYGSYVLATRSYVTGRFPDWSQFTYSDNPAQPLASATAPFDFDYLTFEVLRDAA
jgi:hypothetical protein